ncbi:synaptophysin-like [Antedon mediterranea]|uniref:synaptophysin-like n=1 Tax=Antedon mediterranea TaxID=105859 RepID=UPI003AF6FF1E
MANNEQDQPWRLRVLLEPKGFIKILEFILSVCMFATTAGYSDDLLYNLSCPTMPDERKIHIEYPFQLNTVEVPAGCTSSDDMYLGGDASGAAKFFVAIGVLAFLYVIAITAWYVFLEHKHLEWDLVPMVDFGIHCVFTFMFFIASCVWAAGVNEVKDHTDFDNMKADVLKDQCSGNQTCKLTEALSFASLNVSLLFGFLNVVVWGGNCWFVYKETSLFGNKRDTGNGATGPPDQKVEVPTNTI